MRPAPFAIPVRRPASEVPGITGLRFLPGGEEATLVNISTTGLLAESTARVMSASPVQVQIEGQFSPSLVSGRVVRSEVAFMRPDGLLRYNIAIEFETPIALDAQVLAAPPAPAAENVRNRW